MNNKLMTFANFSKENTLQNPKKEALVSGGEDKVKKEKFIDQVKSASLSTEIEAKPADYTKTEKVEEAAEIDPLIANMNSLTAQKKTELEKVAASQKIIADLESRIAVLQGQVQSQIANSQAGTSGPAGTVGAPQPNQPK